MLSPNHGLTLPFFFTLSSHPDRAALVQVLSAAGTLHLISRAVLFQWPNLRRLGPLWRQTLNKAPFMDFLRRAPRLEDLSFKLGRPAQLDDYEWLEVVGPQLKRLRIGGTSSLVEEVLLALSRQPDRRLPRALRSLTVFGPLAFVHGLHPSHLDSLLDRLPLLESVHLRLQNQTAVDQFYDRPSFPYVSLTTELLFPLQPQALARLPTLLAVQTLVIDLDKGFARADDSGFEFAESSDSWNLEHFAALLEFVSTADPSPAAQPLPNLSTIQFIRYLAADVAFWMELGVQEFDGEDSPVDYAAWPSFYKICLERGIDVVDRLGASVFSDEDLRYAESPAPVFGR